ncbi:hypothetical protein [Burkholderia multivorans]|uniref:hypothetical protein n=1 Tax=Burkholderia multivorans TaxID=87883 RepID=UPI001C262610|nr:hypothetical protein [Burkholderia multivorans]MBU9552880.1 hypothetical protein [Burkholderia multivorans]
MTDNSKPRRVISDDARARMRAAARARHDSATQRNHERVRAVMLEIQQEMVVHQGVYPHNKGALSLAEVARRAGIHPFTFHKARYVDLAHEVKARLQTLKGEAIVGRTRVRTELKDRLSEWRRLYDDLLQVHRISETDLMHAQLQLDEVRRENEELKRRLADLLRRKVVRLRG